MELKFVIYSITKQLRTCIYYCKKNNRLTPKRSCLTSLLDLFAQVIDYYDTDNNKTVHLIYLDFQKAFDKVPHKRLKLKVNSHGIQGDADRSIQNWFAGCRQRVCINQSYSN